MKAYGIKRNWNDIDDNLNRKGRKITRRRHRRVTKQLVRNGTRDRKGVDRIS